MEFVQPRIFNTPRLSPKNNFQKSLMESENEEKSETSLDVEQEIFFL